jgi:hypothetical protein
MRPFSAMSIPPSLQPCKHGTPVLAAYWLCFSHLYPMFSPCLPITFIVLVEQRANSGTEEAKCPYGVYLVHTRTEVKALTN